MFIPCINVSANTNLQIQIWHKANWSSEAVWDMPQSTSSSGQNTNCSNGDAWDLPATDAHHPEGRTLVVALAAPKDTPDACGTQHVA